MLPKIHQTDLPCGFQVLGTMTPPSGWELPINILRQVVPSVLSRYFVLAVFSATDHGSPELGPPAKLENTGLRWRLRSPGAGGSRCVRVRRAVKMAGKSAGCAMSTRRVWHEVVQHGTSAR